MIFVPNGSGARRAHQHAILGDAGQAGDILAWPALAGQRGLGGPLTTADDGTGPRCDDPILTNMFV
jgi:hypothetical protein